MKVKKLIEKLNMVDPESKVAVSAWGYDDYDYAVIFHNDLESIEISKGYVTLVGD